jgi:hypothetical protein
MVSGVEGIERLETVAARLKSTVDQELRDTMRDAVKEPVNVFRTGVRKAITAKLPSGYAPTFSGSFRINANVGTGEAGASIRLKGHASGDPRTRDSKALDEGRLRHPVYGRRFKPWKTTSVRPGFWSDPAKKLVDDVRDAISRALVEAARRIEDRL